MEEKKQNQKPEKLTYEQLNQAASELSVQYQKAVAHIRKQEEMLQQLQFNRTAFLLESLFKVMDHAELYDSDFIDWTRDNIQEAIKSFYAETAPEGDEVGTEGTDTDGVNLPSDAS